MSIISNWKSINKLNLIIMNERSGESWKIARYNSVTGTDVAKIMGCDERITPKMLLYNKLHMIDPLEKADPFTQSLLNLGNKYEGCALSDFRNIFLKKDLSYNGYVPEMSAHRDYHWFTGTPDYICDYWDNLKRVVEVKTHWYPNPQEAMPIKLPEDIPLKYWLQVQSYLEIMDIETGFLWSWTVQNGGRCHSIQRYREYWTKFVLPRILKFRSLWADAIENPSCEVDILNQLVFQRGEKRDLKEITTIAMNDSTSFFMRT